MGEERAARCPAAPVVGEHPAGVSSAMTRPRASAAAGRSARPRPSRGWTRRPWRRPRPAGGTCPRARGAAPGRGRRSARRGRAGRARPSRATASETRDRWPPLRAADHLVRTRAGRPRQAALDDPSALAPSTRAKKRRFSRDGEVVVHAGGLGDVADPVPQAAEPAGSPSTVTVPERDLLHADDRAHQRGLAAAGRAEQPGHLTRSGSPNEIPGSTCCRRARPAGRSPSDRVIHHVMNYAPAAAPPATVHKVGYGKGAGEVALQRGGVRRDQLLGGQRGERLHGST